MLTGRKLALTLAFTVLIALAAGVNCGKFFQPNILESIAIQPSTLDLGVGATQQFTAFGTYQDGTRAQLTSGLVWTSTDNVDVPITAAGVVTGVNATSAAVTITGDAQGLSGTATVSVIGDVTNITGTESASTIASGGSPVYLTFVGSPGPPKYITGDDGGNLTISPADNILNCSVANNPAGYPAEECSLGSNPTATSYLLYMTYPSASGGSVTSNTLTLTVQ
jgi:hypothetical protein